MLEPDIYFTRKVGPYLLGGLVSR